MINNVIEQTTFRKIDTDINGTKETIFFAMHREQIVGTCSMIHQDIRVAEIRRVFVAPHARRRHIAWALLHWAARVATGSGCAACVLVVKKDNQAAIDLYSKFGFLISYDYRDGDLMYAKPLSPFDPFHPASAKSAKSAVKPPEVPAS